MFYLSFPRLTYIADCAISSVAEWHSPLYLTLSHNKNIAKKLLSVNEKI